MVADQSMLGERLEEDSIARPMADRKCLVQFIHPGGEHTANCGSVIGWNRGLHKRKFLTVNGAYVDGGDNPIHGQIVFWGEWEPESEVVAEYPDRLPGGPTRLHRPFYRPPSAYDRHQNTDPFVFGDQFHYGICQQHTEGRPTQMRHLDRGSVILFGSCRNDVFVLDTVFVVSHWVDHSRNDYRELLQGHVSETYWDAVMSPLYPEIGRAACVRQVDGQPGSSFRLYCGATYHEPVEGMFSFFPCLPYAASSAGFARPVIELAGRVTDRMRQGRKSSYVQDTSEMALLWSQVADQVTGQELRLGVWAELPQQMDAGVPAPRQ